MNYGGFLYKCIGLDRNYMMNHGALFVAQMFIDYWQTCFMTYMGYYMS